MPACNSKSARSVDQQHQRSRLLSFWRRRPVQAHESGRIAAVSGEREEISRGIATGESLRSIARRLTRSSSTVSREVKANGGCDHYRAVAAHRASRKRAKRPKAMKLERVPGCVAWWRTNLGCGGHRRSSWLESEYRDDEEMQVSHGTIYQSLYVQGRGAREGAWQALRTGRARRRPQGRGASTNGQIA